MDFVRLILGTRDGILLTPPRPCPSLPPPCPALSCFLHPLPVRLYSSGRLEGPLLGPQELDLWLVGTVRALQESMRDVQGRLRSLESMPVPPEQVSPLRSSRARLGQNFEGLYAGLLGQPLLSLSPHLYLPTILPSPENGVA